jgi:hypothetical protein
MVMQYAALRFDIVKSRRLKQRAAVQKSFLMSAEDINREFADVLEASFVVTHGDEAQALLRVSNIQSVFPILEHLTVSVDGVNFRCGVGLGTLNTSLQEMAIGMDGEAWQNAKQAINEAKVQRQSIRFEGFDPQLQPHLNAIGNLLCYLCSRWTKEQRETIRLLSKTNTQREIAAQLGISDAAVSKRLTAAGWQHYLQGRKTLEFLLEDAAKQAEEHLVNGTFH